jgi:hypothetical protein
MMVSRAAALALAFVVLVVPVEAMDRLPVPGGTNGLRQAMNVPDTVPDDMLLVEAARAFYGARDPMANPAPEVLRLIEHVGAASVPLAPGPPLPLPVTTWTAVLQLKTPDALAGALVGSRNAMLLYHGLMGMDDDTLRWAAGQPSLLRHIVEDVAAPFAFAGPAIRVRNGAVIVPGEPDTRAEWESVVGERTAEPEKFVRALLGKDRGRFAWLFASLADLDAKRLQFALGPRASQLERLARVARRAAPEWIVDERPFWRPAFDFTMVLSLLDLKAGTPGGSDEFWREVFRNDGSGPFKARTGEALTSGTLLDILFDEPFTARDRWEVFSLGQRMPGVEKSGIEVGRALRGARQHRALAATLDRLNIADVSLRLALHDASARVTSRDETGDRGDLMMWQAALAVIDRAALTGGLDAAGTVQALKELAALEAEDARVELTAWLLKTLVPRLRTRPGAPQDVEQLLLETMAGALTPAGRPRLQSFEWEDLSYAVSRQAAIAARMRDARAAQGALRLDTAALAWQIADSGRGDVQAVVDALRGSMFPPTAAEQADRLEEQGHRRDADGLRREARRAAVLIASTLLPAFAYVPHLAATDTPELGADIAFRHSLGGSQTAVGERRLRPWQLARGATQRGMGWNLQGSLLLLDVSLASWYLRRNGEPPTHSPVFDELDVASFALVPALARAAGASGLGLRDAATAVARGREAARASADLYAFDERLRASGADPWRRREILLRAETVEQAAAALSYSEAWRLGGAPGLLAPRAPLDGCVCLGPTPYNAWDLAGRRSAGLVGSAAPDPQLRVADYLHSKGLPDDLFGDITAGVLTDIVEQTRALRPDDFRAIAGAASSMPDSRMEEHLLALVADGTLGRPASAARRDH